MTTNTKEIALLQELPTIIERPIEVQQVVDLHLAVHERVREAADTVGKLPDTDKRYLAAGSRCSWPRYVEEWTAYGSANARMPRIPPPASAIDRMNVTLGWIAWL